MGKVVLWTAWIFNTVRSTLASRFGAFQTVSCQLEVRAFLKPHRCVWLQLCSSVFCGISMFSFHNIRRVSCPLDAQLSRRRDRAICNFHANSLKARTPLGKPWKSNSAGNPVLHTPGDLLSTGLIRACAWPSCYELSPPQRPLAVAFMMPASLADLSAGC